VVTLGRAMEERALNAVVTQRTDIAPGLMIIRVIPDGWELPEFKAGQFTLLGLPCGAPRCEGSDDEPPPEDPDKMIVRAYSISSASIQREFLEFYLILVRSGALTPRLFSLQVGDRLHLSPKITGMFTLDVIPPDKNIVMLGTGTGLAPYMSMIRTRLKQDASRNFLVLHGARHSTDLGYRDVLETIMDFCEVFTYVPVVSDSHHEAVPWNGRTGFLNECWNDPELWEQAGFVPDPATTHILLCGNPRMIEGMLEVLQKQGFRKHTRKEPGQIHLEAYW